MSDDQSARLALPYLAAGQMQKHVTLNEALTRLDALVQAAVRSRTLAAQPGSATDGDLYILPADATGSHWAGRPEGALMRAEAGGWSVVAAPDGLVVLVADDAELVVRHADEWAPLGERLGAVQNLGRLGLGATADAGNPFLAKVNAALWTALDVGSGGSGDLRLTLNKESAAGVLSLLFQSGYGGRAELGLVGDDDLRLKVSADGSAWRDVFAVDRTSGRATFAEGAGRVALTVMIADGDYAVPTWARTVEVVAVGGGGGGGAGAFGASGSRFGGGGGGAGGISAARWMADQLTDDLAVTVGSGGVGGVAAAGAAGGESSIHLGAALLLTAPGGGGGGLGDGSSGTAGAAGAGMPASNPGGASSVSTTGGAGSSLDRPDAPGGGGAGGGLDGSGAARDGGEGGDGGALTVRAAGGTAGSAGTGSPGQDASHPALHWAGGGGGGGGAAASGPGFAGADGGDAGGGGGGGGAGMSAGGSGGSGGAGVVWLLAIG